MNQAPYWLLAAFILIGAIWHSNAKSEALSLHVGGYSTHLKTDDATNKSHDLALIEYGNWIAGRFNNSFDRESYAVGYGRHWNQSNVRLSVHVGAIRGYTECYGGQGSGSKLCPFALLSVAYTAYRVQPEIMVLGDAVVLAAMIRL